MKIDVIAEISGFINDRAATMGKITAIEEAFGKK